MLQLSVTHGRKSLPTSHSSTTLLPLLTIPSDSGMIIPLTLQSGPLKVNVQALKFSSQLHQILIYTVSQKTSCLSLSIITGADFHRTMVVSAPGRITPHKESPMRNRMRHMNLHICSQENQQKTAARALLFDSSMHQIVCRLWLRPRPHWGSLQHSPRPLIWV